jgi:hypothetical protein
MYAVATLANAKVLDDLKVFLFTLQLWNENQLPNLYIYCDTFINNFLENQKLYKGKLFTKVALDKYNGLSRIQMEKMPGEMYENRWVDLMCEKMNLLQWAHKSEEKILFCDADICFLGVLPEVPDTTQLGLSRHFIRRHDEAKFGTYNGGFVYSASSDIVELWKTATHLSRYYEQAALEELCKDFKVYEFPIQNNYGWWRLLQGTDSVENLKSRWRIRRNEFCSGISVEDNNLLSVHTHWRTEDRATESFNSFVLQFLEKLKSVEKTKQLLQFLKKL